MKKIIKGMLLVLIIMFLVSCKTSGPIEIIYHLNNGEENITLNYDERRDVNLLSDISRDGYQFKGWYLDENLTDQLEDDGLTKTSSESIDLYASWSHTLYSISYYSISGSLLYKDDYYYQEEIIPYNDFPEVEGYTLKGWNQTIPDAMPNNNLTIRATYTANKYTITYIDPDLDYTVTKTVEYDNPLTLLSRERIGYTFDGWYTDSLLTEKFEDTTMPSHDIVLYAKWEKTVYTISFQQINDSPINPIQIIYGDDINSLPIPSLPGLTFEGWYEDDVLLSTPFTYQYPRNITLTSKWSDSLGFMYSLYYERAEIDSYYGQSTTITFPNSVASMPVLSVRDSAFEGNTQIEHIYANNNLALVGHKAFANMPNLKSVSFSKDTTVFYDNVFFNDQALEELTISLNIDKTLPDLFGSIYVDIPESFSRIITPEGTTEMNRVFVESFYPHDITLYLPHSWNKISKDSIEFASMTRLWIPYTITVIESEAINTSTLVEVIFEENSTLTTLEYLSFYGSNITTIDLPNSITLIEPGAFMSNDELESINIPSSNSYYETVDGVLYNKDRTVLLRFPCRSSFDSFEVPSSVQTIEAYAFFEVYDLDELTFPDDSNLDHILNDAFRGFRGVYLIELPGSLEYIGDHAFANTFLLEYIYIPSSVTFIGEEAFYNCFLMHAILLEDEAFQSGWSDFAFDEEITIIYGYLSFVHENGAIYAISSKNEAVLVEFTYVSGYHADYYISSSIENAPVVQIGSYAFYKIQIFGFIWIPDTVTQFNSLAFATLHCRGIKFNETSQLRTIKTHAFASAGMNEIVLPNSLETIESEAFIDFSSTQIYLPSSVVNIGKDAFNSIKIKTMFLSTVPTDYEVLAYYINMNSTVIYFNQVNPYVVENEHWIYW